MIRHEFLSFGKESKDVIDEKTEQGSKKMGLEHPVVEMLSSSFNEYEAECKLYAEVKIVLVGKLFRNENIFMLTQITRIRMPNVTKDF